MITYGPYIYIYMIIYGPYMIIYAPHMIIYQPYMIIYAPYMIGIMYRAQKASPSQDIQYPENK